MSTSRTAAAAPDLAGRLVPPSCCWLAAAAPTPPGRRRPGRRRDGLARARSTRSPTDYCDAVKPQLEAPGARSPPARYIRGGVAGSLALRVARPTSSPPSTTSQPRRPATQSAARRDQEPLADARPRTSATPCIEVEAGRRPTSRRVPGRGRASCCSERRPTVHRRGAARPARRRSRPGSPTTASRSTRATASPSRTAGDQPTDTSLSFAVSDTAKAGLAERARRRRAARLAARRAQRCGALTAPTASELDGPAASDDRAAPRVPRGDAPAAGRVRVEARADPPVAGALPARGDPRDPRGDRHRRRRRTCARSSATCCCRSTSTR